MRNKLCYSLPYTLCLLLVLCSTGMLCLVSSDRYVWKLSDVELDSDRDDCSSVVRPTLTVFSFFLCLAWFFPVFVSRETKMLERYRWSEIQVPFRKTIYEKSFLVRAFFFGVSICIKEPLVGWTSFFVSWEVISFMNCFSSVYRFQREIVFTLQIDGRMSWSGIVFTSIGYVLLIRATSRFRSTNIWTRCLQLNISIEYRTFPSDKKALLSF